MQKRLFILIFICIFTSLKSDVVYPCLEDICPAEVLCSSREELRYKRCKIYVPARLLGWWEMFGYVYFKTLGCHSLRACMAGYFLLATPLGRWALAGVMVVFGLSSLTTVCQIIATKMSSDRTKKILEGYDRVFYPAYVMFMVSCVIALVVACLVEFRVFKSIYEYLACCVHGGRENFASLGIISCACLRVAEQEEFRRTLNLPEILTIEESEQNYRITIGKLSWIVGKDDMFKRLFFGVLIYSALKNEGPKQLLNVEALAKALGWETRTFFYQKVFIPYQRAGGDLRVILPQALGSHLQRVRQKALDIWLSDINLNMKEVAEKLRESGMPVSLEKMEEALRIADFKKLQSTLKKHYCKKEEFADDREKLFAIQEEGDQYKIRVGTLHWEIKKQDRFIWTALMYILDKARSSEDKRVLPMSYLGVKIFTNTQHLYQLLRKYESLAHRYRSLNHIGKKHQENLALRDKILEMWLSDITLTCRKIAKRLKEQGIKIDRCTVRNLVRKVDLLQIMTNIKKDYQQGKYRKSTEWVMKKYQKIIDDLLADLEHGKPWSKAQIDKFIDQLPESLYPKKDQTQAKQKDHAKSAPHNKVAWLKCFLFNLPLFSNGKIRCPECGEFHTSRKSAIPQPQIVTDSRTGESKCVYTYRFYCHNRHCKTKTFSATADGAYLLDEQGYAQDCFMLRLVIGLCGSYSAVAKLFSVGKSTVFDHLTLLAQSAESWGAILGIVRFSGTLCIDEKFVRIIALKQAKGKRNFAYLFLAVDPVTYDLLHIEIFPSRDSNAVEAFLNQLKAQGIYPKVIMTDLMAAYDEAIQKVFGRSVTISKCHFHFLKDIYGHINNQFGKKEIPALAEQLRKDIFFVVDAQSKKAIQSRFKDLMELKPKYLEREPRLAPMFQCLERYIPHLLRVIEHKNVIVLTNNAAEGVIRHFNRRYKILRSFDSLESALRHAKLFQLFYRFTPLSSDAEESKR